jgi:hypothetical protein
VIGARARLMADYALLGVAPDAPDAAVRRARAAHVKSAHPDLESRDKAAATQRLIAVNDAFARIMAARSAGDATLRAQPWRRSNSRSGGSAEAERGRGDGPATGRAGAAKTEPAAPSAKPPEPQKPAGQARAGHSRTEQTHRAPWQEQARPEPPRDGQAQGAGAAERSTAIAVDPATALELGLRGQRVVGARVWHDVTERAGGFYPDPGALPALVAGYPPHLLPNAMVARSLRVAIGRVEIALDGRPDAGRPKAGRDVVVIPDLSFALPGRVRIGRGAMCLEVVEVIDRGAVVACLCRARGRPDLEGIVFEAVSQAAARQAAA